MDYISNPMPLFQLKNSFLKSMPLDLNEVCLRSFRFTFYDKNISFVANLKEKIRNFM